MKKLNKILSSVLAASMVISCCVMSVTAASKAHTVTISASKTENLVVGDTVVVELTLDNSEKIKAFEFKLEYDPTVFEVDVTKGSGRGAVEAYIDSAWWTDITSASGNWGYYFTKPEYSPKSDNPGTLGQIVYTAANGSEGVEADYADNNLCVGKYTLKVKEGAVDGNYTFKLVSSNTTDLGEAYPTDVISTPLTVTVGEPAPAKTDVVIENPPVETSTKTYDDGSYNAGVLASFTVADTNNAVNAVKFVLNSSKDGDAERVVDLDTTVKAGTVKVALNILKVDSGVTLTVKSVTPVAPAAN